MKENKTPIGIIFAKLSASFWTFYCVFGLFFIRSTEAAVFDIIVLISVVGVLVGLFRRRVWSRWVGMIVLGLLGGTQVWVAVYMIQESMHGITRIPGPIVPLAVPLILGSFGLLSAIALAMTGSYFTNGQRNVSNNHKEGTGDRAE